MREIKSKFECYSNLTLLYFIHINHKKIFYFV
nr:MAG TPA: hypothetical protein [Caudoviricetes sp.]DAR70584.1 MAG TPA: hypothetical protein [Caudoviricetes sp.]